MDLGQDLGTADVLLTQFFAWNITGYFKFAEKKSIIAPLFSFVDNFYDCIFYVFHIPLTFMLQKNFKKTSVRKTFVV